MRILRSVLFAAALAAPAVAAHAGVGIFVNVGPATRAEYRPACPGYGYVWAPGYWNGGYFTPGQWYYPRQDWRAQEAYNRGEYFEHRDRDYWRDRDRRHDHDDWRDGDHQHDHHEDGDRR